MPTSQHRGAHRQDSQRRREVQLQERARSSRSSSTTRRSLRIASAQGTHHSRQLKDGLDPADDDADSPDEHPDSPFDGGSATEDNPSLAHSPSQPSSRTNRVNPPATSSSPSPTPTLPSHPPSTASSTSTHTDTKSTRPQSVLPHPPPAQSHAHLLVRFALHLDHPLPSLAQCRQLHCGVANAAVQGAVAQLGVGS